MSNRERGARSAIKYYRRKDRRKLRAFNHDFILPNYFAEMIGDKKSVLIADLGAGSICTLGNQWPGAELTILASDLLADEYNEIWRSTKRTILNPVTKQDMEALTYPDNYFDIVHCVNAVDHSENPRQAIKEMIRVCKPGGWVYMRHIPHEGENERYHGFHQWNIEQHDSDAKIWSRTDWFFLTDLGNFTTETKTEISNTMYPGEESVVSKLQKPERRIGLPSRRVAEFHLNLEHFPDSERRIGKLDRRGSVDRSRRLTVSDVEKGFAAGEKFTHRDGRRVIAIHPPGYFEGEDGDTLLAQFEGTNYDGDDWDEVQAADLRKAEG